MFPKFACIKWLLGIERIRIAFTVNWRFVFMFSRKTEYIDENVQITLAFHANAKILKFTEKLKAASGNEG